MNWLRRHPTTVAAAFAVGFVLLRVGLFAVTTAGEYRLYRDYAEAARRTSVAALFRTRPVEYPPLAVAFALLPSYLADVLPDGATVLVRWRPNKAEAPYLDESPAERDAGDRYEVALGLVLVAGDLACLALVYVIARRVYPADDHPARIGRLALYAVATGALGLIVYDRQDLVVGAVALAAVGALAAGRPAVGYALLTLGTGFKLVPVLLLPVWVLAAARVRTAPETTPARYVRAVVREAAVAAVILAAWPVASYAYCGDRAFLFLTYHADRGLQVEAPVAWPVPLLDPAADVGHAYGGYNFRGPLADRLARVTRLLMPFAVLAAVGVAARGFWRGRRETLVPHAVAAALLVWLGFVLANKVGSPQYLLWVAPLVPLLPLRTWSQRGWTGLLLLTMVFTTLVFPCRYPFEILGPVTGTDPYTRRGPDALGLFLLAAKSGTLAVATAWLAVSVWRSPADPCCPEPTP